jgi:hypothetical protein
MPYLSEENALNNSRVLYATKNLHPTIGPVTFWSDKCTVERGSGKRREWAFARPKDQPRQGQRQGFS